MDSNAGEEVDAAEGADPAAAMLVFMLIVVIFSSST